jgi:hypothetical protein
MKPHLIAIFILSLSCNVFASDSSPVILGRTAAAVEHARHAHAEATQLCNVDHVDKHELLNWDHIEKEMHELASVQSEPSVTRMLGVARTLRLVRDVLREDLAYCALPLNRPEAVGSVEKGLSQIDDAATDVDSSILNRVVTLESIAKQYKKGPCNQ